MSFIRRLALTLRLVEERDVYDKREKVPDDVLIIPRGSHVAGELHTDLEVIVAGTLEGSVNITSTRRVVVLESGMVSSGVISTEELDIYGTVRAVGVDVDRLRMSATGGIEGNSQVRYKKLSTHEDAQINGQLAKRSEDRVALVPNVQNHIELLADR